MRKIKSLINWKVFWILLAAGIFASFAVLPFKFMIAELSGGEIPGIDLVWLLLHLLSYGSWLGIAIMVGLFLAQKVGLGAPILEQWLAGKKTKVRLKSFLYIPLLMGLGSTLVILGLNYLIFGGEDPGDDVKIALWKYFLACFWGGIGEEILLRLFLMTLLVWVSFKIKKTEGGNPTRVGIWSAIILASLLFGVGHLRLAALVNPLTLEVVVGTVLLNGIVGVVFGWIYWREGLVAAMISHFSFDLGWYILLPSIYI